MTRFKELRRIEAAIEHNNKEEIDWSLAYRKTRLQNAKLKQHIKHWQKLVDKLSSLTH